MNSSKELYHHGILGQKWGVRRFQKKDGKLTPLGRKRKIGVMQPLFSAVIAADKKMATPESLKKSIDRYAKTKKSDVEKLNAYNDYKHIGEMNARQMLYAQNDAKNHTEDTNYRMMERIAGSNNLEKIMKMQYDAAIITSNYSQQKVNEYLKKFEGKPLKQIDSYRTINTGDTTYSWTGKKYILDE